MRKFLTALGVFVFGVGLLVAGYAIHTAESMYAVFTLAFLALGVAIVECAT
jgi:hypothetical protein